MVTLIPVLPSARQLDARVLQKVADGLIERTVIPWAPAIEVAALAVVSLTGRVGTPGDSDHQRTASDWRLEAHVDSGSDDLQRA